MAVDVAVGTVVSLRAIAIAAAQCIVMVLFVGGCVCVGEWVSGSVTTITRMSVHRSSPNWVCW